MQWRALVAQCGLMRKDMWSAYMTWPNCPSWRYHVNLFSARRTYLTRRAEGREFAESVEGSFGAGWIRGRSPLIRRD